MPKSAIGKITEDKAIKIVDPLPDNIPWAPPGASMVVSTPKEVNELMAGVPKGKLVTTDTLRDALAKRHCTTICCPMSTGIFVNIAAKASEEMKALGLKDRTPWWRTLKADGTLNPKAPGGEAAHRAYLEAEGFTVVNKGRSKKLMVEGWEELL